MRSGLGACEYLPGATNEIEGLYAVLKADPDLRKIPVVILATWAGADPEEGLRAYPQHAQTYITKPIDIKQFNEIIRIFRDLWFPDVTLPSDVLLIKQKRISPPQADPRPVRSCRRMKEELHQAWIRELIVATGPEVTETYIECRGPHNSCTGIRGLDGNHRRLELRLRGGVRSRSSYRRGCPSVLRSRRPLVRLFPRALLLHSLDTFWVNELARHASCRGRQARGY
jgi:CheY-like chemotaxis protein